MADVKQLPKVEANLKSEIEKPADLKHVEVSLKNIMPYLLSTVIYNSLDMTMAPIDNWYENIVGCRKECIAISRRS